MKEGRRKLSVTEQLIILCITLLVIASIGIAVILMVKKHKAKKHAIKPAEYRKTHGDSSPNASDSGSNPTQSTPETVVELEVKASEVDRFIFPKKFLGDQKSLLKASVVSDLLESEQLTDSYNIMIEYVNDTGFDLTLKSKSESTVDAPPGFYTIDSWNAYYVQGLLKVNIQMATRIHTDIVDKSLMSIVDRIMELKHPNIVELVDEHKNVEVEYTYGDNTVYKDEFVIVIPAGLKIDLKSKSYKKLDLEHDGVVDYPKVERLLRTYISDILKGLKAVHKKKIALLSLRNDDIGGYKENETITFVIRDLTHAINMEYTKKGIHSDLDTSDLKYAPKAERQAGIVGYFTDVFMVGMMLAELGVMENSKQCFEKYPKKSSNVSDHDDFYKQYKYNTMFSYAIRDFVSLCLMDDYKKRPSLKNLMQHQFLRGGKLKLTTKRQDELNGFVGGK